MKKIMRYLLAPFLCLLVAGQLWSGTFGIDEKIALENSIGKKIEEIVVRMIGDRNIIVLVNIEHNPTIEQETRQIPANPADAVLPDGESNNYLPGIPMEAVQTDVVTRADGTFSQTMKLPDFIKSISITLIVSDKVSDAQLAGVRDYIASMVNLNVERGDKLEIKKMFFAENKTEKMEYIKNIVITQLPWFIGLFLLAFFIFGPLRSFMRNLVSAIEVFRIQADTRIVSRSELGMKRKGGELSLGGEEPQGALAAAGAVKSLPGGTPGQHFSFINDGNINSLIYLLKSEKPDMIAIVMTYVSKEYSSMVLNSLPQDLRSETLKRMAVVRQYRSEDIQVLEEQLKERVDYLLGGPQNIADLINVYEEEEREKVLSDIGREDPSIVAAIRKLLVTTDDIMKLPKEHLYEVYKLIGTRIFASALKGVKDEIRDYVMANLTEGARDMLRQEIDLIPGDLPVSRINQAKKDIITAMKRLEEQGVIRIQREG
ncbi:MAG TPA: hypothetical protein DEE98_05625 [Elusimicrobia bacterium]|nr:MAG: hypothetical protein A2278_01025 [Elusimicrobia bacterium RIFOXYA12_FULL_49_49]OGS15030.1 MAG: hypothetical protein A2251_00015 [Elusimicrobia bacterium RIFOXYA2_FULL_47_53]OGS29368.1 MAG: hypothetical protein A2323_00300 [Elusimicrobia bacterium RIFOXYB2_FULL_46_23]HBU69847.1 hypothetical protein [Elusimicrobiota bacterium]